MSAIAVLNAGSSNIKFAIYRLQDLSVLLQGQVDGIGASPRIKVFGHDGTALEQRALDVVTMDHRAATEQIVRAREQWLPDDALAAVGHRVVHGGPRLDAPVVIDNACIDYLESLASLAPLHQPHNLEPIKALQKLRPSLPQVACFDTGFHRTQAPLAQAFALPRRYWNQGIRRYGFHGISYDYLISRLSEVAPDLSRQKLIVAHLGNGASLCAVHGGRSVASTMGFTALDGLMMGTRSGAIDPGVLIHLLNRDKMDSHELENLLYRQSGLLGFSGVSSDMRTLRASNDPSAKKAIALFVHRIVREIGSLAAALGGLDGIVFSGGIGENDVQTRAEVIAGCAWLGAALDAGMNLKNDLFIQAHTSRIAVMVISTDEELMIARSTKRLTQC